MFSLFFRTLLSTTESCPGIGVSRYQPKEVGVFTAGELKVFFPATPPGPWGDLTGYAVFLTAATTGMRRGEILDLRWRQVDFLGGKLTARQRDSRTKKKRTIGMTSLVRKALLQIRGRVDTKTFKMTDRVFPYTSWEVRKEWEATLSRCRGIPDEKKPEVCFQVLRHTFASLAVQSGVTLEELMKILGHKNFKTVLRYAKFAPDVGVAPMKKLEGVFGDADEDESAADGSSVAQ